MTAAILRAIAGFVIGAAAMLVSLLSRGEHSGAAIWAIVVGSVVGVASLARDGFRALARRSKAG